MMARRACLLCVLLMGAAGCGTVSQALPGAETRAADPRAPANVSAADAAALEADNSLFAGRLLGVVARGGGTVALSPFSISEALAMTFAGARGQTAKQIQQALDFRLPPSRLHAALNALDQALATINQPGVTLDIANALYGQKGEPFRPEFLALLARDYGAGMRIVDFEHATEQARSAINSWVSQRTRGKIAQLLPQGVLDSLTRLVLVNAVYLNAKWKSPFEKPQTSPAPFHTPQGTIEVPTMHQDGKFDYLRAPGYQALELPYRGDRLAFDVLLPDSGSFSSVESRLAAVGPLQLLQGLAPQSVSVALPKLRLRTSLELADSLKSMGMPLAFAPGQADLSGIAGRPGDLYIKDVVHQAYIRVDEAGTEAAAATGVIVAATSAQVPPPITFNVDRPFMFLIRDTKTGAILFLGTVVRP
jgi:serpin B